MRRDDREATFLLDLIELLIMGRNCMIRNETGENARERKLKIEYEREGQRGRERE